MVTLNWEPHRLPPFGNLSFFQGIKHNLEVSVHIRTVELSNFFDHGKMEFDLRLIPDQI